MDQDVADQQLLSFTLVFMAFMLAMTLQNMMLQSVVQRQRVAEIEIACLTKHVEAGVEAGYTCKTSK